MEFKHQFTSSEERVNLLNKYKNLFLLAEWNITEGNFLIFSDTVPEPPIVYVSLPKEEFEKLEQDNTLLKAQSQANSDRADFQEDLIVEMAMLIYS